MATPTELFIADELPRRPYTNEFPFVAGKTLVTTGVGLEVVAGDAPGEYLDNTFRIKDNDDTTKKIAFQASGIAAGETRTITMPNADVDLGDLPFIATTNTNNLTNTTARILGGSGGTASKPNATIITGASCTADGGLSVVLTGNNVNTTLGGAVVQGAYQANDAGWPGYTGQAAIKQGVVIYAKTTTATSAAMDSAGGAAVTTAGDTKVIAAVVPNGMTGVTTGSAVHEITIIGKSITGTYQAFSAKYIITCSYDGTTYTIDSMTTLHTSSRNGALLSAAITLAGSNLAITATSGSAQTILWSGYVDSIYD